MMSITIKGTHFQGSCIYRNRSFIHGMIFSRISLVFREIIIVNILLKDYGLSRMPEYDYGFVLLPRSLLQQATT